MRLLAALIVLVAGTAQAQEIPLNLVGGEFRYKIRAASSSDGFEDTQTVSLNRVRVSGGFGPNLLCQPVSPGGVIAGTFQVSRINDATSELVRGFSYSELRCEGQRSELPSTEFYRVIFAGPPRAPALEDPTP